MRYHYTNAQNQPVGPVELAELEQLSARGVIDEQTAVIEEGGQQWTTWGALRRASAGDARSSAGVAKYATVLGDGVGVVLGKLSQWLSPELVRNTLRHAGYYGHFAVIIAVVFGLIAAMKMAQQAGSFAAFAVDGVGMLLCVAVAQFSAQRFMSAGTKLIASTPNRLASESFVQCVGLFSVLGALALALGGIVTSIKTDSLLPLVGTLLPALILVFFAALALHPEELNVTVVADASAGEEAVALLAFAAKAGLMLAPVLFVLVAIVAAVVAVLSVFNTDAAMMLSSMVRVPFIGATQSIGMALTVAACLIPVVSYLWFLLIYLGLDLLRSILSVPAKLDALKK